MHQPTPVLQAEGLSFDYPNRPLFNQLSFLLSPGVTWVCGDEGSGKTTLLQLLAGTLPTGGQLHIIGVSLAEKCQGLQTAGGLVRPAWHGAGRTHGTAYFH